MDVKKGKLTDQQLRIVQVIAGILSSAALLVSILVASPEISKNNKIVQYLFLVVFLIIMFGRRRVESKYRLRLNLFNLVLIDGILAGVLIYTIVSFFPAESSTVQLDVSLKILIVVAVALILLIVGIALPLRKYFKRIENGTLPPIRLPEKQETPETDENNFEDQGPMTIEQQIAAMTKELDQDKRDDK
ncbi:MAG: hypothetical protein ACOX8Q_08360 [Christensenellales bacterium]|jgi:hypothetical protein